MKLIKIETKGFKSFAQKISLNFDGSVIGIVGPNGSGKSNINDAIKWVLGEQSIKSLRGNSSDDVIFSGSKIMPAAKSAQVSLTFDNTEQKISIPDSKITITRIVERGGGSNKYFINGKEARLKDIKEIAMESGIGKSSLAIISQGTISDIAEANPEQRRGVFEEAAGISKYKSRKKEALRKLEVTSGALDKIQAVINELEKQLNPLKKQAQKAKIYLDKKEQLKDVEIALIIKEVVFFSKKLNQLNEELEDVEEKKNNLNENISNLENNINKKTSYKLKLENEIIKLDSQYQEIYNKLKNIEINETRASERRNMIIKGDVQASSKSKLIALKEELEDLSKKISQYKKQEENSRTTIDEKKTKINLEQTKISTMKFEINNNRDNLLRLKAKLNILKDNRDNKSNLYKGVKNIIENKNIFPGLYGIVIDLIKVDEKYKSAIEAILSSSFQNIVVDNSQTAIKAINFLKKNKGGRATFIPLGSIKPKNIFENHIMVVNNIIGFIGQASKLVETNEKFQILNDFLLGNIIIAESIESAKNISETLNNRYMVVSLQGDIIRAGGIMSGGQKNQSNHLFNLDEQILKLENMIPKLEIKLKTDNEKYSLINNSSNEDQAIIAELNIETAKIIEKRKIAENQFQNLKIIYQEQTKETFKSKVDNHENDDVDLLNNQKTSMQTLIKTKREAIINLNNELTNETRQKTEFEKSLRYIIENSTEKLTNKKQAEFIINSSKTRLSEEYEMTIEKASENFKKNIDVEKSRKVVATLRQEIKELGHINLGAIDEFEKVNKRFNKLDDSRKELLSAQETIISAINDMDQVIITRLDNTVKDVNKEFNNVFQTMFGGGFAKVKYTTPSNLLETGIDVVAQPPGKTIKNLKLFSGGEKALIAISLLFAILKSKPLPLCILDEVEAALDDANVVRFADYLQELKKQTQFLVITHRVGTMARVNALFGATMQNRGVTSFFSVKLDEAKKLLN